VQFYISGKLLVLFLTAALLIAMLSNTVNSIRLCNTKQSFVLITIKFSYDIFSRGTWERILMMMLTQCGQLHLPSGACSSSGSRQTRWYALGHVSHKIISPPCWHTSQ